MSDTFMPAPLPRSEAAFAPPPDPELAPAAPGPVGVWELVATGALLAVYLITIAVVGDQGTFLVNLLGPTALGLILLGGVVPAVMRDMDVIWTPLFWFRIAMVAYFCFGNAMTFFLSPESKMALQSFFYSYADLVTKLNAVLALGTLTILLVVYLVHKAQVLYFPSSISPRRETASFKSPESLFKFGIVFLIIGEIVNVFYNLPAAFGHVGGLQIGSINSLYILADVGIYMIAVYAWNFRPSMLFLPIMLTVINIIIGFVEFNKTGVIFSIIVLSLAWLSKGVNLVKIVVCATIIVGVFAFIVPYVIQGRDEVARRYGDSGTAGITERFAITADNFAGTDSENKDRSGEQSSILRFSYVNAGTLAIYLYDSGQSGNTMETLPASFVPRALWPDKPEMTAMGREFNFLANGNDQSASSPGWFAEAYWDYGWVGVPLLMIPVGIIMQLWSSFSLSVLRRGAWLYFPFCMMGMRMGLGPDQFIVPGVYGSLIFSMVALAAVNFAERVYKHVNPDFMATGAASS